MQSLSTESVKGSALSLESVDDVQSGDGLSLGVLGVGDGVSDDVLEENLEDTSGLFVDQAGDSLDTASSSKSSDSGFGDALDVISENLSVTLGASLSKALSSFSSSGHFLFLTLTNVENCDFLPAALVFIRGGVTRAGDNPAHAIRLGARQNRFNGFWRGS